MLTSRPGVGNIGNTHARCYEDNPARDVAVRASSKRGYRGGALRRPGLYSVQEMVNSGPRSRGQHVHAGSRTVATTSSRPWSCWRRRPRAKPISNDVSGRAKISVAREQGVPYAINLNRFNFAAVRAGMARAGRLGQLNVNTTMWINNPNETSPGSLAPCIPPRHALLRRRLRQAQCFFRRARAQNLWSILQANLLFRNGIIGPTGSYDAGGSLDLELVGSEARVVINEACEALVFPRRNQVECFEHLGGMQSFPDTFPARIGAWVDDLLAGTPPDQIDGKAEDALKVQLCIEACIKSWQENKVVAVPQK